MGCGQSTGLQIHVSNDRVRVLNKDESQIIAAGEIPVVIMQLNGESFDLAVQVDSTVENFKQAIAQTTGLESWQQRLTLEGKETEMPDETTLNDCEVVIHSTILLMHNGNPTDREALDGEVVLLQGMRQVSN
jgi:hypothetical protein